MINALKTKYPFSNIVAVDYDPGASNVNQLNRIKLMLSVAFKKLNGDKEKVIEFPKYKDVSSDSKITINK